MRRFQVGQEDQDRLEEKKVRIGTLGSRIINYTTFVLDIFSNFIGNGWVKPLLRYHFLFHLGPRKLEDLPISNIKK
jgi:hypothetical protein